jgi:hypothetical protein
MNQSVIGRRWLGWRSQKRRPLSFRPRLLALEDRLAPAVVANDDAVGTVVHDEALIAPLANDEPAGGVRVLSTTAVSGPGAAELADNGDGTFTFSADAAGTYTFDYTATGTTDRVTAPDGEVGDNLGWSVAIDGDTALVGAFRDDGSTGAAYVFVRSGAGWAFQDKLTAPDGEVGDTFGFSVALDGDIALVGAPTDDAATGSDAGAAYVFVRSGAGWTFWQRLAAADAEAGDQFGVSVAVSGDTALVGANPKELFAGSAYVFVGSGGAWSVQE